MANDLDTSNAKDGDDSLSPEKLRIFRENMRAMRKAKGYTLEQLATATGLTRSYLSRIERGGKMPSIATLMKLVNALDSSISHLFGDVITDDAICVWRADHKSQHKLRTQGKTYAQLQLLSGGSPLHSMEAFLMTPGEVFSQQDHEHHGGEEIIFILEGQIEIEFSDRTIQLNTSDMVQFPGYFLHRTRRVSDTALALIIISRQ